MQGVCQLIVHVFEVCFFLMYLNYFVLLLLYRVGINYRRISLRPVTRSDSVWFLPVGVSSRTMFTSHHIQKHCQNCESASTPQLGTSHKTCLGGFGGNGSMVWTSAVSHVGRTSNAFKATIKLQTFLFQMVVTSCISVKYLWKYGFTNSSDNLYALCMLLWHNLLGVI